MAAIISILTAAATWLGIGLLSVLMVADVVSALVRSAITGEVLSRRLSWGLSIKFGMLIVVLLGFLADIVISQIAPWAQPHINVSLGKLLCVGYSLAELLSILENLHMIGVPMPRWFTGLLWVAKSHVDKMGEAITTPHRKTRLRKRD